jgi:hypothetical protein
VKRILFSITLLFVAGVSALSELGSAQTATPLPYCRPCLFYGGDFDESNPSANALSNSFVGSRETSAVYVPFVVPKGQVWTVTGFFSNNMSNTASLDPSLIRWSISSGVSAAPRHISRKGNGSCNLHAYGPKLERAQ